MGSLIANMNSKFANFTMCGKQKISEFSLEDEQRGQLTPAFWGAAYLLVGLALHTYKFMEGTVVRGQFLVG